MTEDYDYVAPLYVWPQTDCILCGHPRANGHCVHDGCPANPATKPDEIVTMTDKRIDLSWYELDNEATKLRVLAGFAHDICQTLSARSLRLANAHNPTSSDITNAMDLINQAAEALLEAAEDLTDPPAAPETL